jgi:hypothetical protein
LQSSRWRRQVGYDLHEQFLIGLGGLIGLVGRCGDYGGSAFCFCCASSILGRRLRAL